MFLGFFIAKLNLSISYPEIWYVLICFREELGCILVVYIPDSIDWLRKSISRENDVLSDFVIRVEIRESVEIHSKVF